MDNDDLNLEPYGQTQLSQAGVVFQAFQSEHHDLMQTVLNSLGREGSDVLLRQVAAKASRQERLWILRTLASSLYPPALSAPAAKALVREALPLKNSSVVLSYVKASAGTLYDDFEGRELLAFFAWKHGANLPYRPHRCEAYALASFALPKKCVYQDSVLEDLARELDYVRCAQEIANVRGILPSYIMTGPFHPDVCVRPLYIKWLHKTACRVGDASLAASCAGEAERLTLPGEMFGADVARDADQAFLLGRPDFYQWQKRLDDVSSQPERYAGLLDMMLGATGQMDQEARAVYCAMLVDRAQAVSPSVETVVERGLMELVTQASDQPTTAGKLKALHGVFSRIRREGDVLGHAVGLFREIVQKTDTNVERFELFSDVLMLDGKAPSVQSAIAREWAQDIEQKYEPKGAAAQALFAMEHIHGWQYHAKSELVAVVLRAEPRIDDTKLSIAALNSVTKAFPTDLNGCPPKVHKQIANVLRRLQRMGQVACKIQARAPRSLAAQQFIPSS